MKTRTEPTRRQQADEEDEENYLVDHSIVLYLVSHKVIFTCMAHPPTPSIDPFPYPKQTPQNQIGPDGSFLDFFTQSMQPPDIVGRIKRFLAQATRVTK